MVRLRASERLKAGGAARARFYLTLSVGGLKPFGFGRARGQENKDTHVDLEIAPYFKTQPNGDIQVFLLHRTAEARTKGRHISSCLLVDQRRRWRRVPRKSGVSLMVGIA